MTRLQRYYDPTAQLPEAQRARIDPIFFGERYVKPFDARWTKETQPFQRDMVHHLLEGTRFDPEIIKEYPRPSDAKEHSSIGFRTLWIPIEHTKTTWLSIVIPLWTLAVDQETMGALIGNRREDAMKPLGVISWHIENNQLLRSEFPELRPDYASGWSDSRIFVERKSRSKDPSIQTAGITTTIQGARLDWILGDDVQDRTRALSEVKNQKDQENWQEINENRVVDGGLIASYGTLQASKDLTAVLSRSPGYKHMHLSAIDETGKYAPKGTSIWLPEQRIQEARERQGERRFARKYLNDAKDEGGKKLKADWITFVTKEQIPWKDLVYYAGADPATGESEEADPDEYAIAWGGRSSSSGVLYLLGTIGSQSWTISDGTKNLNLLHQKHSFRRVAIEAVAFSIAAKQDVWANTAIPAYKSPTSKEKDLRFETMGGLFEVGRVLVYEGGVGIFQNEETGEEGENFYDQWIDYDEGRHDDRIDAVEKLCEAAMISGTVVKAQSGTIREAMAKASFS